jgi:hypothetical protein
VPTAPLIPRAITDELRRLRRDVERLARTGGYGASTGADLLPDDLVTLAGEETLTNKNIDGNVNRLANIPRSALPAEVVYLDSAPEEEEEKPIVDRDIIADVRPFSPYLYDTDFTMRLGNSTLTGYYRKQGPHVWFKVFFEAGSTFFGGSGQVRIQVPWFAMNAFNQPLVNHYFQMTTQYGGWQHWSGVSEYIAGTNYINNLLPFNNDITDLGQLTEGPGAVPYPGPGGNGWQVISPGSRLWVAGDVFVRGAVDSAGRPINL